MSSYQISQLASRYMWFAALFVMGPAFYSMYYNITTIIEWVLMSNFSAPIILSLILDPKGLSFSCAVLLISANVLSFSTMYMADDKFINRFTILVLLFVLSMNLLIYLPHFMILLLGWDGLGIVSFILVVYYQNPKSLAAGMITAMTNRIGDVMLLLSIGLTLNQGHWNIINMWSSNTFSSWQVAMIMIAAMTKSAQMPFSSWLPAAMAAPTPVSALVHSSTLVTAGVFLLIRFYPFLHSTTWFNNILLFIAVSTMLMAGISATTECDMKKIIALSTLSQLGMMMSSLGLNIPHLAFFHMLTHALFKALLFVCAGTFINSHMHSQDLRWMGNLSSQLPTASSCILIANMALCGFPFMAGFYSKDMILEASLFYSNNMIMLSLIFLAVGLTSFYSLRFMYAVMWSPSNKVSYTNLTEPMSTSSPMVYLSVLSIILGAMLTWTYPMYKESFMLAPLEKLLPLMITIMGVFSGWVMSNYKNNLNLNKLQYLSCLMWFLVPLSSQFIMNQPFAIAKKSLSLTDQSWLETFGGNNIHYKLSTSSNIIMSSVSSTPTGYFLMSSITFLVMLSMMSI